MAATEEGGGRERDERVTRERREKRKGTVAERGAGKKKRKGAREFGALIKPYGIGY